MAGQIPSSNFLVTGGELNITMNGDAPSSFAAKGKSTTYMLDH